GKGNFLKPRSALAAANSAQRLRPGGHTSAAELRTGSWLFSSFTSAASRALPPLQTATGLAISPASKMAALTSFYTSLFSPSTSPSTLSTTTLLDSIRLRLADTAASTLNTPFTTDEVFSALRSANQHSSSGPDGLPYRVYLAAFSAVGPRLAALANSLSTVSTWPVRARTIILPKSGDLSDVSNYRPISFTDSFVRTISRLVSTRLFSVGSQLLPWTQAAFLPGRRSSLIPGILHGLTDLIRLSPSPMRPPPFFVISLDQRKAYDRVLRPWLFAILARLNFLPLLLGVLHARKVHRLRASDPF
ncbi:hypothetical protein CF326_g10105, partial [Tilletia indica]